MDPHSLLIELIRQALADRDLCAQLLEILRRDGVLRAQVLDTLLADPMTEQDLDQENNAKPEPEELAHRHVIRPRPQIRPRATSGLVQELRGIRRALERLADQRDRVPPAAKETAKEAAARLLQRSRQKARR